MEAESSRPEMQVMDPHGAGLVFRNYTRPSCPPGPLHCSLSLCSSLSLPGKEFGSRALGIILGFEKVNCKGRYMM